MIFVEIEVTHTRFTSVERCESKIQAICGKLQNVMLSFCSRITDSDIGLLFTNIPSKSQKNAWNERVVLHAQMVWTICFDSKVRHIKFCFPSGQIQVKIYKYLSFSLALTQNQWNSSVMKLNNKWWNSCFIYKRKIEVKMETNWPNK